MQRSLKPRLNLLLVLGVANIIVCCLILVFASSPALTETVYTGTIYPVLLYILGPMADQFAFSVQEILALLIVLLAGLYITVLAVRLYKKKLSLRQASLRLLYRVYAGLSFIFILFYLLWGFNYFRTPLLAHEAFDRGRITEAAFNQLFDRTIAAVNRLHPETMGYTNSEATHQEIRTHLNSVIYSLDGRRLSAPQRVKVFSLGIFELFPYSGMTLPFLYEVHISRNSFEFEIPFISAHEQTHLMGRALESEANFAAYQACLHSDTPAILYSGHFALLRYLFASLDSEEEMQRRYDALSEGVRQHFTMLQERRAKQSGILGSISLGIYGSYLKAQNIDAGIRNYRAMVSLVLAYKGKIP